MKIRNKLPKFNEQQHIELLNNGWTPMKEPKSVSTAILMSVPLMLINVLITILSIQFFSTISLAEFGFTSGSFVITIDFRFIIGIFFLLIIHEIFHLLFIPNFMKSENTYIGLTFVGGFVYTEQKLSKVRYLFISLAPFVILSILLPLTLGVFGLLTSTWKFLILLNSIGSSVDILGFLLIMVQVPKNAVLRNNGTRTYWKNEQRAGKENSQVNESLSEKTEE